MNRRFFGAFIALAFFAPALAHADPEAASQTSVEQCIEANTRWQNERRASHLVKAYEALRVCAAESCPRLIRTDCAEHLAEVEHAQPSIVFEAKDEAGHDLIDVHVTIDGEPLASSLTGAALAVDPGRHVFAFVAPGFLNVTQDYVIHEGEKSRLERVVFHREGAPPLTPPTVAPPTQQPSQPPPQDDAAHASWFSQNQRAIALGVGAVGLAGVIIGTISGLSATSSWHSATNACSSSSCTDYDTAVSDRTSAMSSATISTVSFIAGGAFLAGGAALFFTAHPASPPQESPTKTGSFEFSPSFGKNDAAIFLRGKF